MPPIPRGRCTVCGLDVPVRRNGTAREHRYQGQRVDVSRLCAGSGQPVAPLAERVHGQRNGEPRRP